MQDQALRQPRRRPLLLPLQPSRSPKTERISDPVEALFCVLETQGGTGLLSFTTPF